MILHTQRLGISASPDIPSEEKTKKIISAVLKKEKAVWKGLVNVLFVDNKTIKSLNKKFLNETGLTDVIAFGYEPDPFLKKDSPKADIYISYPVACMNAKRFKEPIKKEVVRLIVHGTLHLLGYEDHSRHGYARMWKRQETIVADLFASPR